MKKFKELSGSDKGFVIAVLLMMIAAVAAAIVGIIVSPLWNISIIDGVCASFTLIITVGAVLWLFVELLIDMIFNKY